MRDIKKLDVGNILIMKKAHPCDKRACRFLVLKVGGDLKIKCLFCSHEITVPRVKLEKNIAAVE